MSSQVGVQTNVTYMGGCEAEIQQKREIFPPRDVELVGVEILVPLGQGQRATHVKEFEQGVETKTMEKYVKT